MLQSQKFTSMFATHSADPEYPGFNTAGDVTQQDWLDEIGMSRAEFIEPVIQFHADNSAFTCPDDAYHQEEFLRLAGTPDARDVNGVASFYKGDRYARLLAYNTPELDIIGGNVSAAARVGRAEVDFVMLRQVALETRGKFKVLDHGCHTAMRAVYALARYPDCTAVLYDFDSPVRRILAKALARSIVKPERAVCRWTAMDWCEVESDGPFDLVWSNEVLEHTPDPIAELHHINAVMKPGALLFLSTFFNSIHGQNPTHLQELEHYQDTNKWFNDVRAVGFENYMYDPRGVLKGFRKIQMYVERNE